MYILLIGVTILTSTAVWLLEIWHHRYWGDLGVKTTQVLPVLGNYFQLKKKAWESLNKIYTKYKSDRFWGMYDFYTPVLVVSDRNIINDVIDKNNEYFQHYKNLYTTVEENPIFSDMVKHCYKTQVKNKHFCVDDEKYLKKSFSILALNKLKKTELPNISSIINEKIDNLVQSCLSQMTKREAMDVKAITKKCYYDIISTYFFGEQNTSSLFVKKSSKLYKFKLIKTLKTLIFLKWPKLAKNIKVKLAKEVQYFCDLLKQKIIERQISKISKDDVIDLIQDIPCTDKKVCHEVLNIEALKLLHPGLEFTTELISNILELLAQHPTIQEKLRKYLKSQNTNGEKTENSKSIDYLDAIILECSRMRGPLIACDYICVKEYRLPNSEITIQPKTKVRIPVWSTHQDPSVWTEPQDFQPDRFIKSNCTNATRLITPWSDVLKTIGSAVTEVIVKTTVSRIVLQFHLQTVENKTKSSKKAKNHKLIFSNLDHF